MMVFVDILSGLSIAIGVIALITGSIGLVKLPDLFSRTHAVGMMDTAGVGFIILGLIIHEGLTLVSVKLALVGIFLFFTSPVATHAVAQVAFRSGIKPDLHHPASDTDAATAASHKSGNMKSRADKSRAGKSGPRKDVGA